MILRYFMGHCIEEWIMSDGPEVGGNSCIVEAARLITANRGEAERLLIVHRRSADGRCAGCGRSIARWPCAFVAIARAAQDLLAGRPVESAR
jgi:hypothetical protein